MGWCSVECCRHLPLREHRREEERGGYGRVTGCYVVARVLKGDVGAEPEDVPFTLLDLGLLVVVRLDVVMRD